MHPLRRRISIWMTFREVYSRFEGLIPTFLKVYCRFEGLIPTFLKVYCRFEGLIYAKTPSIGVDISTPILGVSSFDSPLKRQ